MGRTNVVLGDDLVTECQQLKSAENHFLPLFGVQTLACEYLIFTHKNQLFTLLPSRPKGLTS
jgi:hypothetical protein